MSAPTGPAKVDGGGPLEKKGTSNGKKVKNNKDDKKEVRDAKNKMKFHATKMDLNLKILREEMSGLADSGNSLSRQMASMYRTLKQVKDDEEGEGGGEEEDTYTDDQESEPDLDSTSARRSYEALDTEDDVNKMSDLDSESCSFGGRKNKNTAKDSGLLKSPKSLQVCDNRNANDIDDEKTPQPSSDLQFTYPTSGNPSDPHITPMSLTLTSTDNDNDVNHDHHHHHHGRDHERNNQSDSESDDESLPDTSSDECSRCLCCSSLASYQNIPWRIQRRDSATTTEASDSSEYCSDSDEEGHRRVPLYAKFNPFFFQEYASGDEGDEETDECEKMDEDADSLPEQTRMSPLGRESSPARASKENPKEESNAAGQEPVPAKEEKVTSKVENRPPDKVENHPPETPAVEEEPDEQSSASVLEKIQRMQSRIAEETKDVEKNKRESKEKKKNETTAGKSNFLSPSTAAAPKEASKPEVKKKAKVPTPEKKEKQRHVSKSHMFIVAPPNSGEHKGKRMVLTGGEETLFEIPASCIDKEGKVTLRPDPKLAPEAYKSGKTITFQVKHTPDGVVATDGPMVLTTNPQTTRTILRVRSSQPSTPTTPTNTKSSVEVTPEGIINIRKRRTVPVRINPVQAIPMVKPSTQDTHSCTHCNQHHQTVMSPQQQSNPQIITRRVTQQTTVTPVYGSSGNQPFVIQPQGMMTQPNQHVIISNQGGIVPQTQQQHIIISPQGGQHSQIIVGPQPVQQRPIQTISVTPSGPMMNQGTPIIYHTNQGNPVQSFQIGSGNVQPQPMIRLGGQSQTMSVRVGNGESFSVPVQGGQPGQMRFVINQ